MSRITLWVCMPVCVIYVCVCVCSLAVAPTCVMDRGRERRAHVSPWQPTCLWPFIKPGGVGEREGLTVTDRALCGTRGGPCCLLTQTAPPCAASERSQHADSVRGYATKSISHRIPLFFFFLFSFSCAFHTETSRLGKAAGCHANGRHSAPQPTKSYMWQHPTDTHGTCSSIRQTGPNAERLKRNGEWSRTHWECESGRGVNLLLDQHLEVTFIYSTILKMGRKVAGRIYVSAVKDCINLFCPLIHNLFL